MGETRRVRSVRTRKYEALGDKLEIHAVFDDDESS
jgi:hypothetical protein